ncbi:MAG TPA: L-rhamnose mutarotase [Candidatus Pullichristensenella excrementipullorum]|nr:L-rhamnose mutarotase [Candidatus Pullichristensenella excrementipullorum]
MKRIAQVIRVKPEKLELYRQLHLNPWKAVAEEIERCNIRNYSIYLFGDVLFSYFEYVGEDYDADMRRMAEHAETKLWWSLTDPCQQPVEGAPEGEWWHAIEEVFHQD